MENRFGVKDFILFAILSTVVVLVVIAMFQYDRQWDELRAIKDRLAEQRNDLRKIQDRLAEGVAVNTSTTTRPVASANGDDPFERMRTAQAMPNYTRGDWLVDAFGSTVGKLSPLVSSDAYASRVQGYVLESLADRDPVSLDWKPMLAGGWKAIDNSAAYREAVEKLKAAGKSDEEIAKDATVPDALQYVFTMRPGVKFSDDVPLTADDVVFTFDFIMLPAINSPREKAYFSRIRKVEKTGENEVTFTFHDPYFEAFELAAGMPILPKHFYGPIPPEEFNNSVGYLLGSGPYQLTDPRGWKPGQQIQLVRNERYWGVQPAFDRLVWKEITNDTAHMSAFRNGDIDRLSAAPEQYQEMIADAGLVQRTQHYEFQTPVGGYRYVAWNQKRGGNPTMFADRRVRQAMTMLIDRDRMIQQIMLGYAVMSTGPFNPLSKQYNDQVKPWPFDPSEAKRLLAEAGFEDRNNDGVIEDAQGRPFKFKLTYPGGNVNYEKMVLFIKDSLARAGVVVEPDPLDWSVMVERLNKKDFDAITLAWTAGIESDIHQMFHSSQTVAEGDNFMHYISPDLDRAISQARGTIDEQKRMPLWREAHKIIHEDQPYTFLFFPNAMVFMDDRIANVQQIKLGLNPVQEWFVPSGRERWTK